MIVLLKLNNIIRTCIEKEIYLQCFSLPLQNEEECNITGELQLEIAVMIFWVFHT
jgi:hypothetical protein